MSNTSPYQIPPAGMQQQPAQQPLTSLVSAAAPQPVLRSGSPSQSHSQSQAQQAKARKACLNCRRQKMKCRIDGGDTCRRCIKTGVPCVFVPRANASYLRDLLVAPETNTSNQPAINEELASRIARIESVLGLSSSPPSPTSPAQQPPVRQSNISSPADAKALPVLAIPLGALRQIAPAHVSSSIWSWNTINHLWTTFHSAMPGLHFLPSKQTFSVPRPLLLAAMLYCSSVRGGPEVAGLANDYFAVLTAAISQVCIPESAINTPRSEEWAFQTVLGLILAGLLREAFTQETGLWISLAYRILLENCPLESSRSEEWKFLFSGIQIVDLEHASLGLLSPVVPAAAPWPALQIAQSDQLYRLSFMMHTGLTHFTGRGLPTVMSVFRGTMTSKRMAPPSFSAVDAMVIRDWARQLDEWLTEFREVNYENEMEKKVVFRQYVLHRVFVLSIYHPVRGCNLFANGITFNEQHELLISARAAVRLQTYDTSIWSNWDLVIITWAAMIVIQGVEGGMGEPTDLDNVRLHLEKLRQKHDSGPSLQDMLAEKLEESITNMQSPVTFTAGPPDMEDPSNWYIFNEASLQNVFDQW